MWNHAVFVIVISSSSEANRYLGHAFSEQHVLILANRLTAPLGEQQQDEMEIHENETEPVRQVMEAKNDAGACHAESDLGQNIAREFFDDLRAPELRCFQKLSFCDAVHCLDH